MLRTHGRQVITLPVERSQKGYTQKEETDRRDLTAYPLSFCFLRGRDDIDTINEFI